MRSLSKILQVTIYVTVARNVHIFQEYNCTFNFLTMLQVSEEVPPTHETRFL